MEAESLLQGAIDLHIHAAPDVVPRACGGWELLASANEARLSGVVLKDHTTSTVGRAHVLNRLPGNTCRVWGSIALNPPVGGLNPAAAESALRAGARVVYFPTYGARNHIRRWGAGKPPTAFPLNPGDEQGISVLREGGGLTAAAEAVLALIRRFDAVLATGHLAPEESLALLRRARDAGIGRLLVTHASESVTPFTLDQQREAADLGALIEHCFFAATELCPHPVAVGEIRDAIRAMGAESCVLSSDLGQPGNGDPVAGFGRFLRELLDSGLSPDELRVMTRDNPLKLLEEAPDRLEKTRSGWPAG